MKTYKIIRSKLSIHLNLCVGMLSFFVAQLDVQYIFTYLQCRESKKEKQPFKQPWPATLLNQLSSPAKLTDPVCLCYDETAHLF